jgi:carboxyl-terminal processing protease
MKKKLIVVFIGVSLFLISWSLSDVKFDDPNKDKLLIEIVKYVLDKGHYESKDINDEFSEKIFYTYLDLIDSQKKYFLNSDLKEFKKYKFQLDDQWLSYDLSFFNLTYERLLQRMKESEAFLPSIFERPFNFELKEDINIDFENMSYSKNNRERKDRWRKQLKYTALDLYDIKILEQEFLLKKDKDLESKPNSELLKEVTVLVRNNINQSFDSMNDLEKKDWFSTYINSFVSQFDPHTYYFQPEAKDRFDMNISGKFDGIGARLSKKDGGIEIVDIILGGPVWRDKKIEIGDEIIKVGQADKPPVDVIGMRLEDAIKLIKGPKGTEVKLTLRKKIDGDIKIVSIVRDEVLLEETYAKSAIIKKDNRSYGLISLPKFYVDFDDYNEKNCAIDVKNEILKLKKDGIEGLVLDLRNNGGGALQTVVDMTGLFIKKGPIVQVKSTGNRKKILSDKDPSVVWDGPLVVLVNQMSASASEILAAALQDYGRAIIIGTTQSFGKGTVQNIVDLNRFLSNSQFDLGALKITTDKFYRINGGSVQIEGVKSDIIIPNSYSFLEIGESDEKNPLSWDKIDPVSYDLWDGYFNFNDVISNSKDRVNENPLASLISENAKWISSKRDLKSFSLNYNSFKKTQNIDKNYISKFDKIKDYKNDLMFELLASEKESLESSNELLERRKKWHSSLSSDFYLNESINVLSSLKSKNIEVKKILAKID